MPLLFLFTASSPRESPHPASPSLLSILCPSPAYYRRRAVLLNLRYNEAVATYHNASGAGTAADRFLSGSAAQAAHLAAGGACTNISFRTGEPPTAAAGRRLRPSPAAAHAAPVLTLNCTIPNLSLPLFLLLPQVPGCR